MRLNFTKGQRSSTTMMATEPPFLSHLTGVSGETERMSRSIALLLPSFLLLCDGVPCLITAQSEPHTQLLAFSNMNK